MKLEAILGCAGSGKSTLINQRILEDNYYGYRTASTGVAAVNMASIAGAQSPTTINSALGFYNAESLLRSYHSNKIYKFLKNISNKFKYIVIDEISMINSAILDLIVLAIKDFNKIFDKDLNLLVCGDPAQLAPVDGRPFFEAECWPEFKVTYLTEVKRQEDKEFVEALNLIRKGLVKEAAPWFEKNIEFCSSVDEHFRGTTFFPTNSEVDLFNKKCLNRLLTEPKTYKASSTGREDPSWKSINRTLTLKPSAIIQIMYNDFDLGVVNGDSAIVEELWDKCIFVSLLRKNKQLYLKERELKYFTFNSKGYRKHKPDGTLSLLHVRLAYGLTCHRAQGLTLDKVQLNLKGPGARFLSRQSGMLYTALSRVRSPNGLRIVGSIDDLINTCYINPNYLPWIK